MDSFQPFDPSAFLRGADTPVCGHSGHSNSILEIQHFGGQTSKGIRMTDTPVCQVRCVVRAPKNSIPVKAGTPPLITRICTDSAPPRKPFDCGSPQPRFSAHRTMKKRIQADRPDITPTTRVMGASLKPVGSGLFAEARAMLMRPDPLLGAWSFIAPIRRNDALSKNGHESLSSESRHAASRTRGLAGQEFSGSGSRGLALSSQFVLLRKGLTPFCLTPPDRPDPMN